MNSNLFLFLYRALLLVAKFAGMFFPFLIGRTLRDWTQLRSEAWETLQKLPVPTTAPSGLKDSKNSTSSATIWFHAASGEVEYAKSVIRELRSQNPTVRIVLTYSSRSAERLLFNIKDKLDLTLPLPWDEPKKVQMLLQKINPNLLVFAKTDFWPELIHQTQRAGVPMGVFSFSLSQRKSLNLLQRWALPKMKMIFTSDRFTNDSLQSLGLHAQEFGDTRFDQVFSRLSQKSKIELPTNLRLITFASTWLADEVVLIQTVPLLIKLGYKIIFCPHETSPEHQTQIISQLQHIENADALKIKTLTEVAQHLYQNNHSSSSNQDVSQNQPNHSSRLDKPDLKVSSIEWDILLIDRVGYLADIYRFSQVSFVGGSFDKKVHSVMEPLCANNLVFVGPYHKNNLEAVEFASLGLVKVVTNSNEIKNWVTSLSDDIAHELRSKIFNLCQEKSGAAKKIADKITQLQ